MGHELGSLTVLIRHMLPSHLHAGFCVAVRVAVGMPIHMTIAMVDFDFQIWVWAFALISTRCAFHLACGTSWNERVGFVLTKIGVGRFVAAEFGVCSNRTEFNVVVWSRLRSCVSWVRMSLR